MQTSRRFPAGLRFGLIGAGDIGQVRAAAVAESGSHRLVAVSDKDVERGAGLAARHDAEHCPDWTRLLERDDIDAVIVSTPPALHEDMCVRALAAGKHVLCEKPLARSPEECRRMLGAAERAGRVLATGFNYRFYPSFALARELLASGAIGDLSHIRSYGGYSATSHNQPWVHDADVVGGGALHDIGIHLIDLTRDYLGDVTEVVRCDSGSVWNFPGCEDNGFLLMRSAAGRVATLHASWTEWGRYQFIVELIGTRGSIRASCFPMRVEMISARETGGKTRRRVWRFPGIFVGEHLHSYRWVVRKSFVAELDAFGRAVAGESSAVASGLDGLRAIEIARGVVHPDGVSPQGQMAVAGERH